MNVLYVGLAGFLGALLRVGLGYILFWVNPTIYFPYPTLMINLLGSFFLAYFLYLIRYEKIQVTPQLQLAVSTGLLGSFTTFSTLSVETLSLIQAQAFGLAVIYILLSFSGGFFFSWLGMKLASVEKQEETIPDLRRSEL